MFTGSLKQWLLGLASGESVDDALELESIMLMFDEFCYQMQQFYKLMDLAAHGKDSAIEGECSNLSTSLQGIMSDRRQALEQLKNTDTAA